MIVPAALFVAIGLLVAIAFVFNVGHVASGMAHWHYRNALRFPRYYRFMDWWSLSRKEGYWRLWGGAFGMIFVIMGTVILLTASAPIGK